MVRMENVGAQNLITVPITSAEFDEFKSRLSTIDTQPEYEFDSFSSLEYDQLSVALFNAKGRLTKSYSVKTGTSTRTGKVESMGRIKGTADAVKAEIVGMLPRIEMLTERYEYWSRQQGKATAMANKTWREGKKYGGTTTDNSHATMDKADDENDVFAKRTITFCTVGTTIASFLLEHVYRSQMYDWSETFLSVVGDGIGRGRGAAYMSLALFVVAVLLSVGAIVAARNQRTALWLTLGGMLCLGAASLSCELFGGANFDNMLWILLALITLFVAWIMKRNADDKQRR